MKTRSTSHLGVSHESKIPTMPASSMETAVIIEIDSELFYLCPVIDCNDYFSDRKKLSNHYSSVSGHSSRLKDLEGFKKKSHAESCKDSRAKLKELREEQYYYADRDTPSDQLTSCQSPHDKEEVHVPYISNHRSRTYILKINRQFLRVFLSIRWGRLRK